MNNSETKRMTMCSLGARFMTGIGKRACCHQLQNCRHSEFGILSRTHPGHTDWTLLDRERHDRTSMSGPLRGAFQAITER
jgi:hypothetical protein